jgi:hypothetical protein
MRAKLSEGMSVMIAVKVNRAMKALAKWKNNMFGVLREVFWVGLGVEGQEYLDGLEANGALFICESVGELTRLKSLGP